MAKYYSYGVLGLLLLDLPSVLKLFYDFCLPNHLSFRIAAGIFFLSVFRP